MKNVTQIAKDSLSKMSAPVVIRIDDATPQECAYVTDSEFQNSLTINDRTESQESNSPAGIPRGKIVLPVPFGHADCEAKDSNYGAFYDFLRELDNSS